jgi:hypothetical protein
MANIFVRLLLFLSSYFPLSVILFFLFLNRNRPVAIVVLIIGTLGLLGLVVYLRQARKLSGTPVTVSEVQRLDAQAMSYIVTYIIPFLSIPFNTWQQGLALSIFFAVIGILYINSNMIHINPMLNLDGYHLYEVTIKDGGSQALIAKKRVTRGSVVSTVRIGDDILLEKKST